VTYLVWDGRAMVEVPVAAQEGEALVVPNVAVVLYDSPGRERLLLQRRDKPGEPVRGLWEIPSGRWRAGESLREAALREAGEETGLEITEWLSGLTRTEAHSRRPIEAGRAIVSVGVESAYPALHVVVEAVAVGFPRPQKGETADPGWFEVAVVRAMLASPLEFVEYAAAVLGETLGVG